MWYVCSANNTACSIAKLCVASLGVVENIGNLYTAETGALAEESVGKKKD